MSHNQKFERALLAYCMAGGAVVVGSQSSHATIIYSGLQNVHVGLGGSFDLDIDSNGVPDFRVYNQNDYKLSRHVYAAIESYGPGGRPNLIAGQQGSKDAGLSHWAFAYAVDAGTQIGPSANFIAGGRQKNPNEGDEIVPSLLMAMWTDDSKAAAGTSGFWLGASDRYLGLQFDIAGTDHYAWVRASVDAQYPLEIDLHDWAYEDIANKPILAGARPDLPTPVNEPSSLALLALGAVAIPAFLRGRRARREKDIVRP